MTITANVKSSPSDANLTTTGVVAGSYTNANITVNAKGRITEASDGGATSVKTLNSNSLAGPGDLDFGTVIDSVSAKTTPIDADALGLMDSADSNKLKKVSWSAIKATLKTYFDTLYAASVKTLNSNSLTGGGDLDLGTVVHGLTAKTTPVDADEALFSDSAASNAAKKVAWSDVKAALKTYFDGIYLSSIGMSNLPANAKTWPVIVTWIGKPAASQVLGFVPFNQTVNFPSGVSGSLGKVLTANPASTYTITVGIYNSSNVLQASGTVAISTSGVFTFTWSTGYTTSAGDYIKFIGPGSADSTLQDFSINFVGAAT